VTKQVKELKSGLNRLKCDMDFDVYARFDTLTLKIDALRKEMNERFDFNDEFITLTEGRSHRYEARLYRLEQRSDGLDQRMDKLDQRIKRIDQRLDKVEQRLDRVEQRLDQVDQRLDRVEQRLDQVDQRLEVLPQLIVDQLMLRLNKSSGD
jgi:chromosome segregation ATPase